MPEDIARQYFVSKCLIFSQQMLFVKTYPSLSRLSAVSRSGLVFILFFIFGGIAGATGLTRGHEPAWVTISDYDAATVAPPGQLQDGFFFLLADEQADAATHSTYNRYVKKIVSSTGVQNCTSLSFDYNKSYGQMVIHHINIIRDGHIQDRLDLSRLKVSEMQQGLAHNQYDDQMTGLLLLEDVRVGDILDVSYTSTGDNPIFPDKVYDYFQLGYGIPVGKITRRLLIPQGRQLHFKYINDAAQPAESVAGGKKVYTWEAKDVKAIKVEDGTPAGYDPLPGVSVSEYNSWQEVKDWAKSIYEPAANESSPQIKALAAEISGANATDEAKVLAAVRYVQDRIRYFGIEIGVNTHKPNNPASTLKLGYGDCKDKSVLLCSLLRAMGIPAHPILINTMNPSGLADHLPTPVIFDHVCVQVTVAGQQHYFDATDVPQPADMAHLHFPDYKYCLVITDSSTGLTPIPYSGAGSSTRTHIQIFAEDTISPARMIVRTIFSGLDADIFRANWNSQSHENINRSYLNFYARSYPTIETMDEVTILEDDSLTNTIQTEEKYRIPDFWGEEKDGHRVKEFFATNLYSQLNRPDVKKRKMPIGISYPLNYDEEYEIVLPGDFEIKRESTSLENAAFSFAASYFFTKPDHTLHLRYTLRTLTDALPATEAPKYFSDIHKLTDMIDYSVSLNSASAASGFSIVNFMLFLVAIIGTGWGCYYIYRRYDPIPRRDDPEGRPIGGWLILPALNIAIYPLVAVASLFSKAFFTPTAVNIITHATVSQYGAGLGYIILLELVFHAAQVPASVLVAILFFKRRSSVPMVFTVFWAGTILFDIADRIYCASIGVGTEAQDFMVLWRSLIFAGVWITYMWVSQRAGETFVYRAQGYVPAMPEPPASPWLQAIEDQSRYAPPGHDDSTDGDTGIPHMD